ncbi:hypothetical protein, partial, partial [Parasitella parasitica]
MSTSLNNPVNIHHPPSLIDDLRQKAYVDKADTETYDVQRWVNSVINLYQQRTNEEIFALLQDLALRIEAWYMLSRQQNQLQQPYHGNPYFASPANNSTAAVPYAYVPSHDPRNFPHYSLTNLPAASTTTTVATPDATGSQQQNMSQLTQSTANIKVSESSVIQLPSWTNNQFPNTSTIEPIELAKLITTKTNPPSILLIDVRPREAFKNGCVKHQWIIQIEPAVLQEPDSVTTMKIQESLSHNPEAEQTLFAERIKFDLIVYYDQNSTTVETAYKPAFNLRRVLLLLESRGGQKMRHAPKMLAGGFDAWTAAVGERGIYRFAVQKEKKPWFKSTPQHSLYDYFDKGGPQQPHISKPQPLPTAPRKESQTNRYFEPTGPNEMLPQQQQQQQQQQQPPKELRPVPPSYPKLHRQRTFIDNPFNGFTTTSSNLYDVPPMAYHPRQDKAPATNVRMQTRPSSAEPTVSISRPSALAEFHHVSTNNIHASSSPTTSPSFSQLNSVVSIGATGLTNLGNTCYMNSIVQCLSGTVPLARYFTTGMFKQHVNKANKKGTGGVLVESLADLVRSMWSENYNFISPMTFREAIMAFAPQFRNNDQHDSQEFLIFILDGLHEDLNQNSSQKTTALIQDDAEFERLPDWQASALSWDRYLATNSSIIVSLFQGQYRSRLTCLSCKHTSTTYNSFMSLSLPIPAKKMRLSSVTLNQCLDYFVKEEVLDKEDAWRCPKCQKKRKASKQLTLSRLPDVLLIQLKRFSMEGLFKNKLDTMVKCPT